MFGFGKEEKVDLNGLYDLLDGAVGNIKRQYGEDIDNWPVSEIVSLANSTMDYVNDERYDVQSEKELALLKEIFENCEGILQTADDELIFKFNNSRNNLMYKILDIKSELNLRYANQINKNLYG